MCGRFYLDVGLEKIIKKYKIKDKLFSFNYKGDIYPTNLYPAIIYNKEISLAPMKWGFYNSYNNNIVINARSETIDIRPMFKGLLSSKRCIIPISGYYEWQKLNKQKIKHKIYLPEEDVFSLAAIYNIFGDEKGNTKEAFVILTTDSNKVTKGIHDRMPVIIREEEEELWLKANTENRALKTLFKPFEGKMIVSKCDSEEQLQFL